MFEQITRKNAGQLQKNGINLPAEPHDQACLPTVMAGGRAMVEASSGEFPVNLHPAPHAERRGASGETPPAAGDL
jgi:hypothetical protein